MDSSQRVKQGGATGPGFGTEQEYLEFTHSCPEFERMLDRSPTPTYRTWLERLLGGKLGGLRPRHGAKIWLLMTLESWLRSTLVRAPR